MHRSILRFGASFFVLAACSLNSVQVAHAAEQTGSFVVSVKVRNTCKISLDTDTQSIASKCSIDETSSTATAGSLSSSPTPTKLEVSYGTIEGQQVQIRTIIF